MCFGMVRSALLFSGRHKFLTGSGPREISSATFLNELLILFGYHQVCCCSVGRCSASLVLCLLLVGLFLSDNLPCGGVDGLLIEGGEEVGVFRVAFCDEVSAGNSAGPHPLHGAGIDWAGGPGESWKRVRLRTTSLRVRQSFSRSLSRLWPTLAKPSLAKRSLARPGQTNLVPNQVWPHQLACALVVPRIVHFQPRPPPGTARHPDRPAPGPDPRDRTRQPENSKRARLRAPAFKNTKIPREDPQERKKE